MNIKQQIWEAATAAGAAEWASITCPSCGRRSKMRVCVDDSNPLYGYYRCWSIHCGVRGFAIHRQEHQTSWIEAFDEKEPAIKENAAPPKGFRKIEIAVDGSAIDPATQPALDYIRSRGVSDDTTRELGLGAVVAGGIAWAVAAPYITYGRVVGWTWRNIYGPKRYMNSKGLKIRDELINGDFLLTPGAAPAIVVEGLFDALSLYPHAVGLGGQPTPAQERKLIRTRRPLVVALDGDTGRKSYFVACKLKLLAMSEGIIPPRITSIQLPPCTDPNSMGRSWILEAASAAK